MKHTTGLLVLVFLLYGAAFADQNDSLAQLNRAKAELQKELSSIEKNIAREDSLRKAEKQRFDLLKERALAQGNSRRKQLEELTVRLDSAEQEIRTLSGLIRDRQSQQRVIQTHRDYIVQHLIEQGKTLEESIGKSLPWDREQRRDRVAALRVDLQNNAASLEEGFTRLIALINEEIEFGDAIVIQIRTVQRRNGTSINARTLRLGNIAMVYIDDAEENYGMMTRSADDSEWVWREELSFAQREEIRNAIKIKESKMVPQLAPIPLPVRFDLEKGGNNE